MALISCEHLCLGYEGSVLLRDLNFEVNAGDYLCIVGENGSGKSTLMRTLLGLQPPLSGVIRFGEGLKQSEIGYLPQQALVQRDFPASVWEVVRSGCQSRSHWRPFYSKDEQELALKNMERMGIGSFAKRCYRELSGGQQQRVLLARALCATRKCLLLDEPTSGLDPKATEQMYRLVGQLHQDGITIIMISHDLTAALRDADHVLHIGSSPFLRHEVGVCCQRKGIFPTEGRRGQWLS